MDQSLLQRAQRWVAWGAALATVFYVLFAAWEGFNEVKSTLLGFAWRWYLPALGLTLLNYALRTWKWHYLLRRVGVDLPFGESAWIFLSGLVMVISPAKAGEVLKPFLVRVRTKTPMATTLPVLITERMTDAIACLSLAALGVSTYYADKAIYLFVPMGLIVLGLAILASKTLSLSLIHLAEKLPLIGKYAFKFEELYCAMRVCVAPIPLLLTSFISLLAWWAECWGYMFIFRGFGLDVPVEAATFIYAFSTVAGGAVPGGLGVADGALVVLAEQLIPSLSGAQAIAAALLIRVATLWMGELIGAFALIKVSNMLEPVRSDQSS
jgi:uncharacterized protein (TIRG00374 family)